MASDEECCYFKTIGNFRRIPGTNMYRSARPDKVSQTELQQFERLKINAIYDLRSIREYPDASGRKLADDIFQPMLVKPSENQPNVFQLVKIDKTGKQPPVNDLDKDPKMNENRKTHFVFDLISEKYVRTVVQQMPVRYKVLIYLVVFLQRVFGGVFFKKFLVQIAINYYGLLGQYKKTIDLCGKEICAVLCLMSSPQNVPGVVCCAHGKDRTGILSALLMGLSGADKHEIALEYNKTEERRETLGEEITRDIEKYGLSPSFREAKYTTMEALMEYIEDKYGSVPRYLQSIGFDMEHQKKLLNNISPSNL